MTEKTKVRKHIVKVEVQSNSDINFNDYVMSKAILDQVCFSALLNKKQIIFF